MGDNTCGCCLRPKRDTIAVVTFVLDEGAAEHHAVLVKLCTLCRHTHWHRAGRSVQPLGRYVYERTGSCDCRAPCRGETGIDSCHTVDEMRALDPTGARFVVGAAERCPKCGHVRAYVARPDARHRASPPLVVGGLPDAAPVRAAAGL